MDELISHQSRFGWNFEGILTTADPMSAEAAAVAIAGWTIYEKGMERSGRLSGKSKKLTKVTGLRLE